jgi:serine/threonine-protein kinase RsbW
MTTTPDTRTVRLDIASRFDMLEVVQTVLAQVSNLVGFGEEAAHYMSVAVRESVVNAMKHGNNMEELKRVEVSFHLRPKELEIRIHDNGLGFDPSAVPDPLAPENLLKAYGRGIFFMRQFMDEVAYTFPPKGGTVVKMLKRLPA